MLTVVVDLDALTHPCTPWSIRVVVTLGVPRLLRNGWGALLDAVRTGRPAYASVFGRPVWDDLEAHPEGRAQQIFQDAGLSERATLKRQSFFDPLPAGAASIWLRTFSVIGRTIWRFAVECRPV